MASSALQGRRKSVGVCTKAAGFRGLSYGCSAPNLAESETLCSTRGDQEKQQHNSLSQTAVLYTLCAPSTPSARLKMTNPVPSALVNEIRASAGGSLLPEMDETLSGRQQETIPRMTYRRLCLCGRWLAEEACLARLDGSKVRSLARRSRGTSPAFLRRLWSFGALRKSRVVG